MTQTAPLCVPTDRWTVRRILFLLAGSFTLLGTVLAMLQLQVYAVVARQGRRAVLLVWGALAALVVLGLTADSVAGLVTVAVAVDATLLAVLTVVSLRIARQPDVEPVDGAPGVDGPDGGAIPAQ